MDKENEQDLYIKSKLKNDDLISKKADDVFNNFFKTTIHRIEINSPKEEVEVSKKVENIENSKEEYKEQYKEQVNDEKVVSFEKEKQKRFNNKKLLTTAASVMILFMAANVYAATQGYNNIFFAIKNVMTHEDVTDSNEILSDRDITISYKNIDVAEGLSIQINKMIVKDNEASLYLKVQEEPNLKKYPEQYLVYDITNKNEKIIANHESSRNKYVNKDESSIYEEEIKLNNLNNSTKKIRLEVQDKNYENLAILEIDLENKEISIVGGYTAEMQKISEVELKEVLSIYAYLNSQYQDADTNIKGLEAEIAMHLVYEKAFSEGKYSENFKYTQKDVNRAIFELTGKELKNYLDFESARCYYDTKDKEYKYYPSDGVTWPLCLEISNISFKDGIYKVTYAYSTPTEDDYLENNIENTSIFESTMKFKLNEDYRYTKYCLVDLDELESKERESRVTANIIYTNNITVENTVSKNTVTNSVTNNKVKDELDSINNYASTMNWTNESFGGMKLLYPTEWTKEWIVKDKIAPLSEEEPAVETLTIYGTAIGKDVELHEKVYSDVIITYYPVENVNYSDTESYAEMIASKLNTENYGISFTSEDNIDWALISTEDFEQTYCFKRVYCHCDENGNGYIFTVDSTNCSNYKYINIVNWILGRLNKD